MRCCGLVPGGVAKAITAGQAARILGSAAPPDAVAAARCELAAAFIDDLRGIGTRIRKTRKKLATAVQAAGTSLTRLFGVGPVIAAAVMGDVRDVSRFGGRDHFAACNGTAPIEVSSGQRTIYRLAVPGHRQRPPGGRCPANIDTSGARRSCRSKPPSTRPPPCSPPTRTSVPCGVMVRRSSDSGRFPAVSMTTSYRAPWQSISSRV